MAVLAFKQPLDEDNMPDTKSKPSGKILNFPQQPDSKKKGYHPIPKNEGGNPKISSGNPSGNPIGGNPKNGLPLRDWVSAAQLAEVAGISRQKAHAALKNCMNGKTWRKHKLQVEIVKSKSGGGSSGRAYQVHASTLPEPLKIKWYQQFANEVVNTPKQHLAVVQPQGAINFRQRLETIEKQENAAEKKQMLIDLIADTEKGSSLRQDRIKQIASNKKNPSARTLYRWMSQHDKGGSTLVIRKERKDMSKRRHIVTRTWDKVMSPIMPQSKMCEIGDDLTTRIRSLWRSGATGYITIQRFASHFLLELTKANLDSGQKLDHEFLQKVCTVSRDRVDREKKYIMSYIQESDAKLHHDKYESTILRARTIAGVDMLPMDIVIGDVHPLDVSIRRTDGSIVYPKAIAWQDVATNRLWITIKVCEKNEGVNRMDVAQSYASMAKAWGIPITLYLDNGSEYSGDSIYESIQNLSNLIQKQLNVTTKMPSEIRAMPYQAQAKPIEGLFSLLEGKYFAMLPGYTGGQRMNKKTHNVGKEPETFPGDLEAFHNAINIMLGTYHATPQDGFLGGQSPNGILKMFIDKGWQGSYEIDEVSLMIAFSERGDTRVVGSKCAGYIRHQGELYYHDALLEYTGVRLPIIVPRHDPRFVFIMPPGEPPICAVLDQQYDFYDPNATGAKEKQRRKKALARIIREQKENCDRLDLLEIAQDWTSKQEAAPQIPSRGNIEISEEVQALKNKLEEAMSGKIEVPKLKVPALYGNQTDPLTADMEIIEDE